MFGIGRKGKGSDWPVAYGPTEKQRTLALGLAGVDRGVSNFLVGDEVDRRGILVGVFCGPFVQVSTQVRRDEVVV